MDKLKKILAEKTAQDSKKGKWFAIQWQPDLATGECLNIGVGIVLSDGSVEMKMLDYFDRIECLYSQDMIFHAELACRVATESITRRGFETKIAPQISCVERGFTQGTNAEQILNRLYSTVVTLGHKRRVRAPRKSFHSVNRDNLYTGMQARLMDNLELEFDLHVPTDPYQTIRDGSFSQQLYLPFRKKNGNATLVSAAYKDEQRVKCNLYDGYRDIDIAAERLNTSSNAIFMILPGDGLEKEKANAIENDIDTFVWQMKRHNVYVDCEQSQDILADKISEWCVAA